MLLVENKVRLERLASSILALTDYSRMLDIFSHPGMAQYVITGPQYERVSVLHRIGYCVQVRRGCGLYGSDLVFLRHPDGALIAHENQCFFTLTDEQLMLARHLFSFDPVDEPFSTGYRCPDGVHEVGFLLENSASRPSDKKREVTKGFSGFMGAAERLKSGLQLAA